MAEERSSTVEGLIPRMVRLKLEPGQAQVLLDELLTRIQVHAAQLQERRADRGRLNGEEVSELSALLAEYRALIDDLGTEPGRGAVGVAVTASMATADALVRACAARAVDQLRIRLDQRSGNLSALRDAGAGVAAWATSLADLRHLDESAPELILD